MGTISDAVAAYVFPPTVPPGQYTVDCIKWEHDSFHTASVHARVTVYRIDGGPSDNELVFDWWDDDQQGVARVKVVAESLGLTIPAGWEIDDAMAWFVGKRFTVNVRDFDTPRFQVASRVEFDGYVAQV